MPSCDGVVWSWWCFCTVLALVPFFLLSLILRLFTAWDMFLADLAAASPSLLDTILGIRSPSDVIVNCLPQSDKCIASGSLGRSTCTAQMTPESSSSTSLPASHSVVARPYLSTAWRPPSPPDLLASSPTIVDVWWSRSRHTSVAHPSRVIRAISLDGCPDLKFCIPV